MSEVSVFNFQSLAVRTTTIAGEPWFVAADVCKVLEIQNVTQAMGRLDEDERAMLNIGRQGEATVLNESGLYSLILGSRKPEAKTFKKWVTSEVLPSIRKTGLFAAIPVTTGGLVQAIGTDLWVTTPDIANIFEKRHFDVVSAFKLGLAETSEMNEKVRSSLLKATPVQFKMEEISYTDSAGRQQKGYRVNRPLFNYVVLNFTGDSANNYRYLFINQFEEVDKQCKLMLAKQAIYQDQNKQSVYVLKNELTGLVKIGVSASPAKRANELSNQSGCELQIVYTSPKCKNAYELEQTLHKYFAGRRKVGEWFALSEHEVVQEMQGLTYDFGSGLDLLN